MENLFFIGIVGVALTFVIGLTQARPYSEDNQEVMGKLQRKLCISYTAFFGALALLLKVFLAELKRIFISYILILFL